MRYKVRVISVRDSDGRGFLTDDSGQSAPTTEFADIDTVRKRVPQLLRGLSSYWQVQVVRADTEEHVYSGFRAGPGGTGERWVWREA